MIPSSIYKPTQPGATPKDDLLSLLLNGKQQYPGVTLDSPLYGPTFDSPQQQSMTQQPQQQQQQLPIGQAARFIPQGGSASGGYEYGGMSGLGAAGGGTGASMGTIGGYELGGMSGLGAAGGSAGAGAGGAGAGGAGAAGAGAGGGLAAFGPAAGFAALIGGGKLLEERESGNPVGRGLLSGLGPSIAQMKQDPKLALTTAVGIPFINGWIRSKKAAETKPEWGSFFGF